MRFTDRRTLLWTLAVLAVVGAAVTVVWFSSSDAGGLAGATAWSVLLALAVVCSLTLGNLAVRWLRWHYLCRRLGVFVPTKDSARIYSATLPAIATPFYVGELSRAFLVGPPRSTARRIAVFVWFAERCADAVVVGIILLFALGQWTFAGVVAGAAVLPFFFVGRLVRGNTFRTFFRPATLVWVVGSTTIAWIFPILALTWLLDRFSGQGTVEVAAQAFTAGSLLAGLTGIPLGVGLAGSTAITVLASSGIAESALPLTMVVFRAGTVWFAIGLGLVCLTLFGRRLLGLVRSSDPARDHFDDIAAGYANEIGDHVRDRLLARKVDAMTAALAARGVDPAARGLDIGCGQGWYATEMAARGYRMSGCDLSAGQIEHAQEHAEACGASLDLRVGSAIVLPYDDDSFDFAYSINVFHHLGGAEAQQEAFAEVARVLRPGGVFFLQEMNTRNLLFRFYMSYLFPLMCDIDEGTESWIRPDRLPHVARARWCRDVHYFTFLPDFTPAPLLARLEPVEGRLERSRLAPMSAHYVATLEAARVDDDRSGEDRFGDAAEVAGNPEPAE